MSVVVTPGFRTDATPGWRAGVAAALSVALGDPRLWLLGALGFAARGGLVFLALPIVTVPSPIVLSTVFRGQISTTGLSDASGFIAVMIAVAVVVAVAALLLAAYADVAAFELLAEDPDTDDLRTERDAVHFSRRERLGVVVALAAIQAIALVPAGVVTLLVASRMEQVLLQELVLPSSFTEPLFVRIIAAVSGPLVILAATLVLADLAYSLAGRAVLVARSGLDPHRRPRRGRTARSAVAGALRMVTRPGRTMATALLAWPVTIVVLTPVIWAAGVAWTGLRSLFLSPAGLSDPDALPAIFTVTVIFGAIWVAATILAGFASAVRAALWSADALR